VTEGARLKRDVYDFAVADDMSRVEREIRTFLEPAAASPVRCTTGG
jgi:hypothetical protein